MITFIAAHPMFVALFCFACACALLLVALVWALDYIRARVPFVQGVVRQPTPVITHVPRSVGIPSAYRAKNPNPAHWS